MEYILLTGADGNLGGKLTKKIADETESGVIAVSSFPERIPMMMQRENIARRDKVKILSSDEMFKADLKTMGISGAVHFAFSRAVFPNKDIADSLDYSLRAFSKMVEERIPNCIYISSQSVYGDTKEIRTESTCISPNSVYAMAKYAGEKLFESCYLQNEELNHTILRLDNVIQSQNLVRALCEKAKNGMDLELVGGKQVFSYIDASEVPDAVYAMLVSKKEWKPVYNVGPHEMRVNLVEVAKTVQAVAKKHGKNVSFELQADDRELWAGMNTSLFMNDTGWRTRLSLSDMVENIYQTI